MFGKIVIFVTLLAVSFAEVPVNGPYAASGWRPQGNSFDLPNEYLAPLAQRDTGVELEITKERVDFAGQFSGNNAGQVQAQNSAYLPPSSITPEEVDEPAVLNILRVQGLPVLPSAQFKIIRAPQLNTREYYPQRQFAAQLRRLQKFSGNIRQQQFGKQTRQRIQIPAVQYSAPVNQPASQYGAPAAQPVGYPEPRTPDGTSFNFPTEENEENTDSTVTNGEYFVLTPEKTLQKVSYRTSQTAEEARNNGFSAELKYTPVEKIDGPLYKYNEQGQLVRIYKK